MLFKLNRHLVAALLAGSSLVILLIGIPNAIEEQLLIYRDGDWLRSQIRGRRTEHLVIGRVKVPQIRTGALELRRQPWSCGTPRQFSQNTFHHRGHCFLLESLSIKIRNTYSNTCDLILI